MAKTRKTRLYPYVAYVTINDLSTGAYTAWDWDVSNQNYAEILSDLHECIFDVRGCKKLSPMRFDIISITENPYEGKRRCVVVNPPDLGTTPIAALIVY